MHILFDPGCEIKKGKRVHGHMLSECDELSEFGMIDAAAAAVAVDDKDDDDDISGEWWCWN